MAGHYQGCKKTSEEIFQNLKHLFQVQISAMIMLFKVSKCHATERHRRYQSDADYLYVFLSTFLPTSCSNPRRTEDEVWEGRVEREKR